jgi:hypothetical protein
MPDGTPTAAEEKYWAARDPKEFAKEYFARIGQQTQGGAYGYLGKLQLIAQRHYWGALPSGYANDMPSSAEAGREGDQGNNVTTRANWIRDAGRARVQIITGPKLSWECTATTTDASSLTDASRGSLILESMWRNGPYESLARDAVEGANVFSEEFLFTPWDDYAGDAYGALPEQPAREATPEVPEQQNEDGSLTPHQPAQPAQPAQEAKVLYKGGVCAYPVAGWNVLRDTSAKSFEQSDWLTVRLDVNRYRLIAKYPAFKTEILKAPAPPLPTAMGISGVNLTTSTNTDKVQVHYFFHKRRPELPKGLQAVMLDADTVLSFDNLEDCYSEPNPFGAIHRMYDSSIKGTPFAYANFWEAMATQDIATDVNQSLATNIVTFGRQMISAVTGTDLAPDQIGNGPVVLYKKQGADDPKAIQLYAPNPEAFKHLDRLRSDIREAFGLNDLNFGEAPTGAPNAQAWALLSSASVTANSEMQSHYVDFVKSIGRSLLAIFKAKATWPQKIALVGKHGPSLATQDEFDKEDFTGISDVSVSIGNPLSQSTAGRLTIAQDEMKQGWVLVPEQYEQLIETGKSQPLTQGLRDELIHIASENEQMLEGETPPAMITDSHQMHVREHKAVSFNAAARANPAVIQAMNQHIQAHLTIMLNTDPRVLAALGQAAPQPPQQPLGAPQPAATAAAKTLTAPGESQQDKTAEVKPPSPPQPPQQPQPNPKQPS